MRCRWVVAAPVIALVACGHPTAYMPPPMADDVLLSHGEALRWTFDEPAWRAGSGVRAPRPSAELFEVLGHWKVEPDASAPTAPNALVQRGRYAPADEPRLLATKVLFASVATEVACKVDARAACGLLFGAQGSDRYVVARADARSGTIALVVVAGDDATALASAAAPITPGQWHRLAVRVDTEAARVEVTWDGVAALAGPLPAAGALGRVGLAAGGEGGSAFDDWSVRSLLPTSTP